MNEKVKFIIMLGLWAIALVFICAILITRAGADSERFRQLERDNTDLLERVAEQNRRASELSQDVRSGLDEVATSLNDGTKSISARIREVAKTVADMENRLLDFERRSSDNNGTADSAVEE